LVALGQSVHVNLTQNTSDNFTYTISDGSGGTDPAAVHIDIFGLGA